MYKRILRHHWRRWQILGQIFFQKILHDIGMRLSKFGRTLAEHNKPVEATGWTREFMDDCYLARVEIIDTYPLRYIGPVICARHEFVPEMRVVLVLNWVLQNKEGAKASDYGGTFEIIINPALSRVMHLEGTNNNESMVFLSNGAYIVISKHDARPPPIYRGESATPRIYTWF